MIEQTIMPSAVIGAYKYDAGTEILTIRYHSGKVYNYLGVPEKVFKESARPWLRASRLIALLKGDILLRRFPSKLRCLLNNKYVSFVN